MSSIRVIRWWSEKSEKNEKEISDHSLVVVCTISECYTFTAWRLTIKTTSRFEPANIDLVIAIFTYSTYSCGGNKLFGNHGEKEGSKWYLIGTLTNNTEGVCRRKYLGFIKQFPYFSDEIQWRKFPFGQCKLITNCVWTHWRDACIRKLISNSI